MTDAPEVTFDAPAKKPAAKSRKKAAKQRPAAKPRTVPFPGLTRSACADGCNAKGCVISGRSYCAHPTKGGLQPDDMGDTAALKRIQQARDQLDVRLDPDRFK